MSCKVYNGHPGCSCCTPEPNMIICSECNGDGYTGKNDDGEIICGKCMARGEVEDNYEPDNNRGDE